jgi:hypothetical protein
MCSEAKGVLYPNVRIWYLAENPDFWLNVPDGMLARNNLVSVQTSSYPEPVSGRAFDAYIAAFPNGCRKLIECLGRDPGIQNSVFFD